MRTVIGSSGRDSVLINLLQLYGSKTGLFKSNLFWAGQYYPHPLTFILEEELIEY